MRSKWDICKYIYIYSKQAHAYIHTYMHRDTHTFTILTPPSFFHFPPTHDRALLEKYYLSIRAQAGAGGGGGGGGGDGNGNGGGGRGSGIRRFLVVSPEERERQQRERAWRELQRQHNDYNARLEALDTASTPLSKLEGFGGKRPLVCRRRRGLAPSRSWPRSPMPIAFPFPSCTWGTATGRYLMVLGFEECVTKLQILWLQGANAFWTILLLHFLLALILPLLLPLAAMAMVGTPMPAAVVVMMT
jgi:hypothetical protein